MDEGRGIWRAVAASGPPRAAGGSPCPPLQERKEAIEPSHAQRAEAMPLSATWRATKRTQRHRPDRHTPSPGLGRLSVRQPALRALGIVPADGNDAVRWQGAMKWAGPFPGLAT